jgi:hypothetical protein
VASASNLAVNNPGDNAASMGASCIEAYKLISHWLGDEYFEFAYLEASTRTKRNISGAPNQLSTGNWARSFGHRATGRCGGYLCRLGGTADQPDGSASGSKRAQNRASLHRLRIY